jgi:transposase-like protein
METERYGAAEKCRAVLAVWTERQQASALCRELGVSSALFSQWQDRALAGMLEALEARGTRAAEPGPALPPLLKRLLDRKVRAREIAILGRSLPTRTRPARRHAAAPPAATATS